VGDAVDCVGVGEAVDGVDLGVGVDVSVDCTDAEELGALEPLGPLA